MGQVIDFKILIALSLIKAGTFLRSKRQCKALCYGLENAMPYQYEYF